MKRPVQPRILLIFAIIALIAGTETFIYARFKAEWSEVPPGAQAVLNSAEAQAYIQNTPQLLIIDTRTQREYASGHLAGALNMPLHSFHSLVLSIPENRPVLLYCLRGFRSFQAYKLLRRLRPDIHDIRYVAGQMTELPQ